MATYQSARVTGRKWCGKAPGFGKDSVDPPNTGKGFPHPLPAVSMTRAQAAHDHFRIQGIKNSGKVEERLWPSRKMVKLETHEQTSNSQICNREERVISCGSLRRAEVIGWDPQPGLGLTGALYLLQWIQHVLAGYLT